MPLRDRDTYASMRDDPNVQGALGAIRAAEGTAQASDPYSVGFGHTTLDSLDAHPGRTKARSFVDKAGKKGVSTAAGAYQMVSGTWNSVSKRLGLTDFSPLNQDIAAMALMDEKGALQKAIDGDIKGFVSRAKGTWASLPGAAANQPTVSLKSFTSAWNAASNVAATQVASLPNNVPTPTARPTGGLLGGAPAAIAGLLGTSAATPTSRPATLSYAQEANLASRLGPASTPTPMDRPRGLLDLDAAVDHQNRIVAEGMAGMAPASNTLSAAKAANVTSRLDAATRPTAYAQASPNAGVRTAGATASTSVSPTREANLQGRIDAGFSKPSPGFSFGPNEAAAATISSPARTTTPAPAAAKPSTGFAGPVGSPRSMEATIAGPTAGARYAPAPRSVPTPTVAARPTAQPTAGAMATGTARVSFPTAAPAPLTDFEAAKRINAPPASFQTPAFSTAKPALDALGQPPIPGLQRITPVAPLPAPVAVARPPKVATVPRAVAPVSQVATAPRAPTVSTSTGLGLPGIPDAPDQPGFFDAGGLLDRNKGKIVGGLLGTAVAGPIGGLLGSIVGTRIQNGSNGTPSNAAQAAGAAGWDGFSGMTAAQSQAALGARPNTGGLLGGFSFGGLLSGRSGGGQISSAARDAARTTGFDGFGYSGSSSRSSGGSTTSSASRSTSSANRGSGGGGGIGPGGSGARDPSGSSRK